MDEAIVGGLAPPPGVTPNFVNPPTLHLYANITLLLCLAITTPLVWLRLYTRFYIMKSHGLDDYSCFIAWLGLIGYCVIWWITAEHGAGVHQWDVPLTSLSYHAYLINIQEIYYAVLIFIAKLSLLALYLRLFAPLQLGRSKTYCAIHALIWSNFIFYLSIVFIASIGCLPRKKIFNPSIPGRCVNPHAVIISTSAVNVVSDFAVLLVPQGRIWNLNLSRASKIGLSAIFLTGLSGCGTSIARLLISIQLSKATDQTYVRAQDFLWTYAEVTSAILVGVFPVLPQFFRHHSAKLKFIKTFSESGRTAFSRPPSLSGKHASAQGNRHDHGFSETDSFCKSESKSDIEHIREAPRLPEQGDDGFDFTFGDFGSLLGKRDSGIVTMA